MLTPARFYPLPPLTRHSRCCLGPARRLDVRSFNVFFPDGDSPPFASFPRCPYHYALLSLTPKPSCHYPGISILDFPPELDGVSVSDTENFVLEPFVNLLSQQPGQVIAAGSAFAGLEGGNRIELSRVWV
jgi:hypothetical protein